MSRSEALPRAVPPSPQLTAALARAGHRLGAFGHRLHCYDELRSTSDVAAMLAEQSAGEGAVVIADAQTAGRGRHGRVWCSPPGAGLYVSVVLRPPARTSPLITLAAGVAVVEGIRAATGLTGVLKWPNDVMIPAPGVTRAAKLAGILAESGASHVILGIGVNIRPAAYPPEVAARATSLEGELGRAIDRDAVLVEILAALAARYDDLRSERFDAILDAWRTCARPMLGRAVEWDHVDGVRRGVAEDVDRSGALLVRSGDAVERLVSGEVRWV